MKKITHRTFFAIELSPQVKTKLLTFQDRLLSLEGNPINANNFHITLSFLGELSERKIETILDNLRAPPSKPFEIEIANPIYLSRSNILAAEVTNGKSELNTLKRYIENSIQSWCHFNIEKRDYIPHISLFRKVEYFPENLPDFKYHYEVDSFCLMTSTPAKKGVQYQLIEEWRLNKHRSVKESLLGSRF